MKYGLGAIGAFSAKEPKTVIAIILTVTLVSAVLASSVQMEMGMELYIDHDSETWKELAELKDDFGRGNNVFVVMQADDFNNPEVISSIDALDEHYSRIPDIEEVRSIADLMREVNGGTLPTTNKEIESAIKKIPEEQIEQYMPKAGLSIILARYGDADAKRIVSSFKSETSAVKIPAGVDTTITGEAIFEQAAFGLMLPEMMMMFGGAFLMIIILLYFFMHKVRGKYIRFLPLFSVLLGMMWMMGAMGIMGYNFDVMVMAVMPISLGLGIDYAVHIHTRYEEERKEGNDPVQSAKKTIETSGKALVYCVLTTVIGLGSLLLSEVPPVRNFGVLASISVVSNMILSLTFIPAVLALLDKGFPASKAVKRPPTLSIERVFEQLSHVVTWRPVLTLSIIFILVGGGLYSYAHVETTTEMMDYWPPSLEAFKDIEQLKSEVASPSIITVTLNADVTDPIQFRRVYQFETLLLNDPKINSVDSIVKWVVNTNPTAINSDKLSTTLLKIPQEVKDIYQNKKSDKIALDFYTDDITGKQVSALTKKIQQTAQFVGLGPDVEVSITGKPILNRNVILNVTAGLTIMTVVSFTLGFLFLILVYRSLKTAIILILVIVSAVAWVAGVMYLLHITWNPMTVMMASLTLGAGIDYGIHFYERYKEGLEKELDRVDAIKATYVKLSRPLLISVTTSIAGFGVLIFSIIPVLFDFGKAIVLSLGFSLVAAFFVLPPLLQLLDSNKVKKNKEVNL